MLSTPGKCAAADCSPRIRALCAFHGSLQNGRQRAARAPPADFSNNVGHHHRHYFGRLHRRAGFGDETEDTGDHSRTGPQYPFYLFRPRPRRATLARQKSDARARNLDVNDIVTGVGEDFFRVRNLKLAQGIELRREDIRQQAQVAVIDQNTREKLFSDMDNPLGQIILIGPVPCTVIGVTQSKKDIFGDQQNLQIWIPYSAANSKLLGQSYFGKITVRLRDGQSSKSAEHSIEELLAQRHGDKDFFIFNMDSMLKAGQQQNQLIRLFLLSIAVISLIVGGIGVMNIMLVSVTERTREIGIRMAVGARQSDILQQFLVEAVAVCLSGGLIGILLSFGIGAVFSALVEQMKMIFSVGSIIAAALCSTLIGVVFGFMPARNAARLNPVDALARD